MSGGASILITGGAGFIGTNVALRLLGAGVRIRILDSLVRPGSEGNAAVLQGRYPGQIEFIQGDVRNAETLRTAVKGVQHIYHFAAQVAVTTSLADPREDFAINAGGTLNVLEAARACQEPPSLLFASTNKVYGALADVALRSSGERYVPSDQRGYGGGIKETRPLEFHSPYGCSKGAADQYVLDYARSFGLRSVVMRMSCIYGPHQNGTEDQGWVAHFVKAALGGRPVTVYGSGRQVRDVLFVEDLVDAFERARTDIDSLRGRVFNIGGGPLHAVSILEMLQRIETLSGHACEPLRAAWRTGDQRYYVSDTSAFERATGWLAQTSIEAGLSALFEWLNGSAALRPLPAAGAALRMVTTSDL